MVPPFAADGGKPVYFLGPRILGYSILKKGSPDRVKEVLRMMDFFAAPFGSEEYNLTHYGVKDVHYALDGAGNPVADPTRAGGGQLGLDLYLRPAAGAV